MSPRILPGLRGADLRVTTLAGAGPRCWDFATEFHGVSSIMAWRHLDFAGAAPPHRKVTRYIELKKRRRPEPPPSVMVPRTPYCLHGPTPIAQREPSEASEHQRRRSRDRDRILSAWAQRNAID